MDFRTILTPPRVAHPVSLQQRLFTIGSCFSDTIGQQLHANKFVTSVNPFGVSYNPISIHTLLNLSLQNRMPGEETFLTNNELTSNYLLHSRFSSSDKSQLQKTIQSVLSSAHNFLAKTSWVLITYGTAWVHKRKDTKTIVNNCHKLPAANFEKVLLNVQDIVDDFSRMTSAFNSANPTARFVMTVSPVRHVKDTLELNSVSKAILRQACHELCQRFENVSYFPAYEIMMDDLRDYRFYKSDMLHPTDQAGEYIWEKFASAYLDPAALRFLSQWKEIQAGLDHRPFHPGQPAHQQFLRALLEKIERVRQLADVEHEWQSVKSQLL